MPDSTQRAAGLHAAEANRLLYETRAEDYDSFEDCVVNPEARGRLRGALESALNLVGREGRVLDACGGTGYASGILVELGARPTTVDVSAEMLSVWKRKAAALGYSPDIVEAEILEFLRERDEGWDMIVFSSALHHLEEYCSVVELAAQRLNAGGVLVTIFDPTVVGKAGQLIRRLDYLAFVLLKHPRLGLRKAIAKLRGRHQEEAIGRAAELHAGHGVDDLAIRRVLERAGMEVLVHERRYDEPPRLAPFRLLFRLLRKPSSFSFLARRRS